MSKKEESYISIIVETYCSTKSGLNGFVHVRPIKDQRFPTTLHVECSKKLIDEYPIGTKFRLKVKLTDLKKHVIKFLILFGKTKK